MTKPGKRAVDSYTIEGTTNAVKAGDCVLIRPYEENKPPYVAQVVKLEADGRSNVNVRVRWYYRPEESIGGRRLFHGAKEVFSSDHYDVQSAKTIQGKCTVHNFKAYTKLKDVGVEDYYCRFNYKVNLNRFTPSRVAVYCKCELPYNPDNLMVKCDGCEDWFHPSCLGMTDQHAKDMDPFLCTNCSPEDKKPVIALPPAPASSSKAKVGPKRRRK